MEQFWEPLRCQSDPKMNKMEPKLLQDEPKGSQVESQEPPKVSPRTLVVSFYAF